MNNFTPKRIKSASKYLGEKYLECQQKEQKNIMPKQNAYKLKEQKSTKLERFLHMVFKS